MGARKSKDIVHRRPQRGASRVPAEGHARRVDHVSRAQPSAACDRRFTDPHGTVRVALVLDGGPSGAPDRARHPTSELQIVVGGVDYRIDLLLDEITADDQDSRFVRSHTSAMRSSSSAGVAVAIPRMPIDSMVRDAHATPQTKASCRPER